MKDQLKKITLIAAVTGIICSPVIAGAQNRPKKTHPMKKGVWVSLFDGRSLKGWHTFKKPGQPVKDWVVENGTLACLGKEMGPMGTQGDILTDKLYSNFELAWEWKVTTHSNSGVMYHVIEDLKYFATFLTGPEYQLIDETGWPDKLEEWQKAGADYAMHLPNDKKKLSPTGEWNSSKIVFNKGHVEHWLNGQKILEFQAWSPEWNKLKSEEKWKDQPDYGMAKTGHIALQDHGNKTYYRNIKIKEL